MLRSIPICLLGLCLVARLPSAAEISFDFSQTPLNQTPPGFRSTLSGKGQPGDWKIVPDEVPSLLSPLTPKAEPAPKRPVLAQLSGDITDERFPLLIYEGEIFSDFTLMSRFKIVSGALEQMAGIAFRVQDENNYYYVRASALGNTFRFYKVVAGVRSPAIGPETAIARGVWHDLTVECKGNQIRCLLNGREIIPAITDNSFTSGKIGFWTKSDSVSHFVDTKITYTPREILAKALIKAMMQKYPRLIGLKIYSAAESKPMPRIIASTDAEEVGKSGGQTERDVIAHDTVYYGKAKQSALVTLPLHDRNGDTIAAVRVTLKSFRGQTQENAVARALPIVKEMEARIRSSKDLLE